MRHLSFFTSQVQMQRTRSFCITAAGRRERLEQGWQHMLPPCSWASWMLAAAPASATKYLSAFVLIGCGCPAPRHRG